MLDVPGNQVGSGSISFFIVLAQSSGASGLGAKSVLAHVQISLIYGRPHCSVFFSVIPSFFFLQKTSFSVVKSRLALGSPVCLFVVTMPKWLLTVS